MLPEELTRPAVKGSVTFATCGALRRSATSDSTSCLCAADVSFCPSGASMTTRAVAPPAEACGNSFSSRSMACWDWVPGSVKSSVVLPDTLLTPMTAATSTAIHASSTSRRRRKASRPSR